MAETQSSLRIGAAQLAEVYLDREATVEKDCSYIRKAGEIGLDLVVFPEFHVPSSPKWYRFDDSYTFPEYYRELFNNAVTVPGPAVDRICEAAEEADTAVVVGVNEKRKRPDTGGTMYNSQVFVDADGTLLGVRRKLTPTTREQLFHTGGTGHSVTVFESSVGTLGGLVCGEHFNHLLCHATLAQGEEVHAAGWPAWPWRDRETRERCIGLRTRFHAYSGKVPTVSATGVMTEELAESIGNPDWGAGSGTSSVISPGGEYLAGPKWTGEGIVHAEVDLGERVERKAKHDVAGHYNRFDIFDLEVTRESHEPLSFADDG